MKKVLFVATVYKHIYAFHLPYIKWFVDNGYRVDVAAKKNADDIAYVTNNIDIPIARHPFKLTNIKAIRQLKNIIEKEQYDLVYCHTAMGAVAARLASISSRKTGKTKVLYVAHGFHFFKGCPKKFWMLYYPIEKYLSQFTDGIVTINQEDYEMVKTHNFKNKDTFLIPGIGVPTERFVVVSDQRKSELRKENGFNDNDFILIYVAEYIYRKNHKFIIDSIPLLIEKIPNLKILFAGRGILMDETINYNKSKGLDKYVEFLGFRKDIGQLVALSDIGISASRQEGLGLNIAEEMFCKIPVVATIDRGHKELIINGETGFMFKQGDHNDFANRVIELYDDNEKRTKMGNKAFEYVQKFRLENSLECVSKIFKHYL
ncbi:MAG: glycosyltransferase family 4 protein [Rikenellaceae bacterium]